MTTPTKTDRDRLIEMSKQYGWRLRTAQMDPSLWTTIQMERKATVLSVSFTPRGRLRNARIIAPRAARGNLWGNTTKIHERRTILDDALSTTSETDGAFCRNCGDAIIKYDGHWLHYGSGVAPCRIQNVATPR